MVAAFSETFRIILPDTPGFSRPPLAAAGPAGSTGSIDEYELDALDALCARLKERQVIHRMSDRETMINVSQVVRSILLQDDPGGQSGTARPSLYAVNCSECHLVGGSQLASASIDLPVSSTDTLFVLRLADILYLVGCSGEGGNTPPAPVEMSFLRSRHHFGS